jgi:type VI secretion system protein ImpG
MTDELLPYYDLELAFIRKLGAEFARANPKIAGRLRWSGESSEDPHVSRLIEAFAFLNARTRHKIEDEFPEVSQALLSVLYPHYLSPLPSAAIAQFRIDPSQGELTAGYRIPRGSTVETEPIDGQPCRFRTAYELQLWPLNVAAAAYQGQPFSAPRVPLGVGAEAVLRLKLQSYSPKVQIAQLPLHGLRCYLHGPGRFVYDLYELLLNDARGVVLAADSQDPQAVVLNQLLAPVGFARDEGLYDYSSRSFLGYRLLTEYFAFPEKFLFFDLPGLTPDVLQRVGRQNHLEIFIYLNRHVPGLEQQVGQETFRLGCSPIVNIYKQRAEPIRWTHTQSEYRVVPDARRPAAHEVYSIDRVVASNAQDRELEFAPFYSSRHALAGDEPRAFWHMTRRPAGYAAGQVDRGTEVYVSLVDLNFEPARAEQWILDVETTCLNRDLPGRLQFGGGHPHLQLMPSGPLDTIRCLTPPNPTYRPALQRGMLWRLISHLSLNHLSLADNQFGAEALREILKLYDVLDTAETRTMIEGLAKISSRRVVGRVAGAAASGFCRGLELTLHLDEDKFSGGGSYLFASVLERFLALYASLNSFTQTVVRSNRRSGIMCQWPPRAGEQSLV